MPLFIFVSAGSFPGILVPCGKMPTGDPFSSVEMTSFTDSTPAAFLFIGIAPAPRKMNLQKGFLKSSAFARNLIDRFENVEIKNISKACR